MENQITSQTDMTELLEKDAAAFLQFIRNPSNHQEVLQWFNGGSKTYRGYYSTPPQLLLMLTGKLIHTRHSSGFYGSNLPHGIPEKLALEIFKEFTRFPMDPSDQNYYDEDLQTFMEHEEGGLTYRVDHDILVERMIDHFKLYQEPQLVTAEPIPPAPSCGDPYPAEGPPQDPYAEEMDTAYSWPVPAPTPPTYDGHFQNFVDNMDEYYYNQSAAEEFG